MDSIQMGLLGIDCSNGLDTVLVSAAQDVYRLFASQGVQYYQSIDRIVGFRALFKTSAKKIGE